jgi:hypothetical protein
MTDDVCCGAGGHFCVKTKKCISSESLRIDCGG